MTEHDADAVLDASALLALLNEEPGADAVAERMNAAVMSTVNLAEVASKLCEVGMPLEEARAILSELGIRTVRFDEEQAYVAASIRPSTRRAGLSLGDRACLALVMILDCPAITTDRAWKRLKLPVPVVVAR